MLGIIRQLFEKKDIKGDIDEVMKRGITKEKRTLAM